MVETGVDRVAKIFGVEHLGRGIVGTLSPSFQLDLSKVIGLDTSNGFLANLMTEEVVGLGACKDIVGPADGFSCLVKLFV